MQNEVGWCFGMLVHYMICVHTVLSNAKAPYGATTVYVSATGSDIALAQKNQTDGPSARLTLTCQGHVQRHECSASDQPGVAGRNVI